MARERKTRNIKKLLSKKAPLPTKTEVSNSVARITNQKIEIKTSAKILNTQTKQEEKINSSKKTKSKTISPTSLKQRKRGRPKKEHGRVKFTTILDPTKRDKLKILAIHQKRNVADILDEIIDKYLKNHGMI